MGNACFASACFEANLDINGVSFAALGTASVGGCPAEISLIQPFELCTDSQGTSTCAEIRSGSREGYVLQIVPLSITGSVPMP